jgi:hypothetical protein
MNKMLIKIEQKGKTLQILYCRGFRILKPEKYVYNEVRSLE